MKQKKTHDITIVVDGKEYPANRLVLSACSHYFFAMFTNNLKESTASRVTLYDLDRDTFEQIHLYAYTNYLTITHDNVQSLLEAATFLQISKLQDKCCKYLKTHADPSNCLGIEHLAEWYFYGELVGFIKEYVLRKFEDVVDSEEFLLLDVEHVIDIIRNDRLYVSTEITVYEAIMRWASTKAKKSDKRRRHKHLCKLLEHIRFSQMKINHLEKISCDKLIKSCATCNSYVNQGLNYLLGPIKDRRNMMGPRFQPRLRFSTLCLYTATYIFRYNEDLNKWIRLSRAPVSFESFDCLIVLDNMIYIIGSEKRLHIMCFQPGHSNQFIPIEPPPTNDRFRVGATSHEGSLYVIGGQSGNSFISPALPLVEKYTPRLNEWTRCSSLGTGRMLAGIAVLDHLIYAVGGLSDSKEFLNTVECYDSDLNQWHFVAPMNEKRSSCGCVALMGFIYVIGGCGTYTRDHSIQTGERYDPRKNIWEPIPLPPGNMSIPSLAVVDGLILAISTYSGSKYVYAYDPMKEKWFTRIEPDEPISGQLFAYE